MSPARSTPLLVALLIAAGALFTLANRGLPLVRGTQELAPRAQRALRAAHALSGVALVLIFNLVPFYRAAEPAIPELEVDWIGTPLSLLDNLRMKLHLEQQAVLANIDAHVPPGATLYMLDMNYYGNAQQGVFEPAGLIRADVATRYVSSRSFQPEEYDFYVYSQRPPKLDALGHVTDLGFSLYHVDSSG